MKWKLNVFQGKETYIQMDRPMERWEEKLKRTTKRTDQTPRYSDLFLGRKGEKERDDQARDETLDKNGYWVHFVS